MYRKPVNFLNPMKTIFNVFENPVLLLIIAFSITTCSNDDTVPGNPDIISFVKLIKPSDAASYTFWSLSQKGNGDFLISGSYCDHNNTGQCNAVLFCTNSTGDTLWTKYYMINNGDAEGRDAVERSDGSILLSGITYQQESTAVFLLILDDKGTPIRTLTIPVPGNTVTFNQVLWSEHQGRLIYEFYQADGTGYVHSDTMHIIYFDDAGEITDNLAFPGINCSSQVRILDDGSLLIAGNASRENNRSFQLLKVGNTGEIAFRNYLNPGSDKIIRSFSTEMDAKNNYLLAGNMDYGTSTLCRSDEDGNATFKTYFDSLSVQKNSIRKTMDGGFLFMNYCFDPPRKTKLCFAKLDQDLKVVWVSRLNENYTKNIVTTSNSLLPSDLIATQDGAFAFIFDNYQEGLFLVKTVSFK